MGRIDWGRMLSSAVTVLLIALALTFGHAGLQSDHGLAALGEAEAERATLAAELEALRAERAALQNKVARLSPDGLDLEMLDERARAVLGLTRADEIVIR